MITGSGWDSWSLVIVPSYHATESSENGPGR